MIKFSTNSITKILLIACVGIVFFMAFLHKKDEIQPDLNNVNLERDLKDQVKQLWVSGPRSLGLRATDPICPSIQGRYTDYPENFFECNPHFIECWVRGELTHVSELKIGADVFIPVINSFSQDKDGNVSFSVKNSTDTYSFYLKRSCHQTEVPNRVFSAGSDPASKDLWDTYLQKLKVDKYYVSKYEYKLLSKPNEIITPKDSLPFLSFDYSLMEDICFKKGGSLLSNRLMSALSYFPSPVVNGYMYKSSVPWDKGLSLKDSKENFCGYFYSSDCKISHYSAYSQLSPGWINVYHLLGSEIEVFDNQISKGNNLKLSSRYFSAHDPVHKNGFRRTWNKKMDSELVVDDNKLKTMIDSHLVKGFAFRCMY